MNIRNTVELCVRRDPSGQPPQGTLIPLRRISHVRLEVTDLEVGRRWYADTFGLVEDDQVPGDEQITLTVPRTGQLVILHRVDEMSERSTRPVKGPHADFRIASEHSPVIVDRFDRNRIQIGESFGRPAVVTGGPA
jgi:catechol-2,3-dioxygenase